MSSKTLVTGLVTCAVALLATLEYSRAASPAAVPVGRVGVISIRGVFNNSRKHAEYRAKALASQSEIRSQLEVLSKEIEVAEAELKTLKQGTDDHLRQLQIVLEKRSRLETQQEYLKQQRSLQDKRWMEDVYQEVLKIVKVVAAEKGLDMVLEQTEPEFPISSEELMLTFSTHKVLYDKGCMDLTQDVIARLDTNESLKP